SAAGRRRCSATCTLTAPRASTSTRAARWSRPAGRTRPRARSTWAFRRPGSRCGRERGDGRLQPPAGAASPAGRRAPVTRRQAGARAGRRPAAQSRPTCHGRDGRVLRGRAHAELGSASERLEVAPERLLPATAVGELLVQACQLLLVQVDRLCELVVVEQVVALEAEEVVLARVPVGRPEVLADDVRVGRVHAREGGLVDAGALLLADQELELLLEDALTLLLELERLLGLAAAEVAGDGLPVHLPNDSRRRPRLPPRPAWRDWRRGNRHAGGTVPFPPRADAAATLALHPLGGRGVGTACGWEVGTAGRCADSSPPARRAVDAGVGRAVYHRHPSPAMP